MWLENAFWHMFKALKGKRIFDLQQFKSSSKMHNFCDPDFLNIQVYEQQLIISVNHIYKIISSL